MDPGVWCVLCVRETMVYCVMRFCCSEGSATCICKVAKLE